MPALKAIRMREALNEAAQVGAEISPGSEERRDIKERRQEKEKHDLWVELDSQQPRHKAED